jgi:chaperone BCS1
MFETANFIQGRLYDTIIFAIIGYIIYYFKGIISGFTSFVNNYMWVSITVDSTNQTYNWIRYYLTEYKGNLPSYKVKFIRNQIYWSLGPGSHTIILKNIKVSITYSEVKTDNRIIEYYTLTTYSWNLNILKEFLNESKVKYEKYINNVIDIYSIKNQLYHVCSILPSEICHDNIPILPDKCLDNVLSDVQRFINSESIYKSFGIPYRRGYLFYGVPGSGKSLLIRRIAKEFSLNIIYVGVTNDFDWLKNRISLTIDNNYTLIVFEDIDIFTENREQKEKENKKNKNDLNQMFDLIDGSFMFDKSIFVLTTNYYDQLDSALIRSGRIDFKLEFGYVTKDQIEQAFDLFFKDNKLASKFYDLVKKIKVLKNNTPPTPLTMSDIQGILLKCDSCPEKVFDILEASETFKIIQ